MLNLRTHHIIVSRDIIWLNRMHGENTPTTLLPPQEELFEDDLEPQPDTVQPTPGNLDNIVNSAIFKVT